MEPEMPREELQAVARRPAKGSLKNFFGDLRDLMQVRTLRATVQEFVRDDALGLAAQLAYYLILAIFPFILFLVAVLDAFGSSSPQFVNELFDYLRRVMPAESRPGAVSSLRRVRSVYVSIRSKTWAGITLLR